MSYSTGRGWAKETIKGARLGFWDGNRAELIDHLKLHEIDVTHDVVKAVLKMPPDHLVYSHWRGGKCIYMTSRTIRLGDKGKMQKEGYLPHYNLLEKLVGKRQPYFNHLFEKERWRKPVLIVEGQADAVTLAQWGLPAAAIAGLSNLDGLLHQLGQAKARAVVALDNEPAETKAAEAVELTLTKLAEGLGPAMKVVKWPEKDANDCLKAGMDEERAKQLIAEAPIYALRQAARLQTTPRDKLDEAKRALHELIASMMPYDYAVWATKLADGLFLKLADLNRIIKAIRVERDLASQGVEEARPIKDTPKTLITTDIRLDISADDAEFLISQARDHEGHAQCVKQLFGDQIAFVPEWGWLTYNGKHWDREGGQHLAERLVVKTLKYRRHLAVEHDLEAH
jgi:hypothetical protein